MSQFGAARDYVIKTFEGAVAEQDGSITTAATPVQVVPNDPDRVWLTMINVGANSAYVWYNQQVSSTNGILLNANGGLVNFNVVNDMTMPAREWWSVQGAGASTIVYLAVRRFGVPS